MKMIYRANLFFASDLIKNKFNFFFGLIQITVIMLLIGYMVQLGGDSIKTISEIKYLEHHGNMYQIDCIAESEQIDKLINTKGGQEKFKQFYVFLNDLDNVRSITADSSLSIFMRCKTKEMADFAENIIDGLASFATLRVSNKFFSFYNIGIENISKRDMQDFFSYNGESEIPAIMGYSFKEIYDYNEIFYDEGEKAYKVIGFLEKNETYVAPFETDKAVNLNDSIIVPITAEPLENGINYITYLVSTFFVTDDASVMNTIVTESNRLELLPLEYRSLSTQITYVINDLQNEAITMGSILLLIFIFASTGIISYMINFIQERLREFAIHMFCGANYRDVILRIIIQIIYMLLVSDLFVILVFDDLMVISITVLISILYGLVIVLYPLYVFKQNAIIDIIRRN